MLFIKKPSIDRLKRFVSDQAKANFNYREVGATAGELPPGYVIDRTRVELGQGEEAFLAAKDAIQSWTQFRLGWVEAWSPETPIVEGKVVAVMGWAVGMWWLNACRIVYVVDEPGDITRFGFAYGTLPQHVEKGEERFLLEWNRKTDVVTYDILAFSQPNHILTRLGYPLVRRSQKRFGRESAAAMFRAVNDNAPLPRIVQQTG